MKKILIITSLISFICLSACKKDNETTPDEPIYSSFIPLSIGNYWVYEVYEIDTSGKAVLSNYIDSSYIDKDTLINGKTFYTLVNVSTSASFQNNTIHLRDSSGILITSDGSAYFDKSNLNKIILEHYITNQPDTLIYAKVYISKGEALNLKAGNFSTTKKVTEYEVYKNNLPHPPYFRYDNIWFTDEVGIVQKDLQAYYQSTKRFQQRLVRYHIN